MAKKDNLQKPSREFEEAIIHSGSIIIDCQLCGRIHFGDNENALIEDLGEKEYKELLKNSEKIQIIMFNTTQKQLAGEILMENKQ